MIFLIPVFAICSNDLVPLYISILRLIFNHNITRGNFFLKKYAVKKKKAFSYSILKNYYIFENG